MSIEISKLLKKFSKIFSRKLLTNNYLCGIIIITIKKKAIGFALLLFVIFRNPRRQV